MSSYYITTPIYYVNAKPHLGHAYTTVIADSLSRFHKIIGDQTWFLTGTDEHGDKIVKAAAASGETPKQFTDRVSDMFKALWPELNIQNDQFIRTTDADHMARVQQILQKVYDNGDIYFGEFGGHYCTGCERFYTEKELENGLCPQHLTKPDFIQEKNYFFRMSKYLPWIADYIRANPDFIRPERYRNEVLAMLEGGVLEDLCISRPKSRLTWGIELPFDKDYVCYVWFDALINYISALGWPDGEKFKTFWPGEHLVAKDILKPHGIFWPAILKAAGLPMYKHLNVHGYWLSKDTKMSKSLGNVVSPLDMMRVYGLDAFRYFLLREMNFGSDANFSEEALVSRLNSDLANDLGNLFSRVLSMDAKYFASKVPASGPADPDDEALMELADNALANYIQLFRDVRFSQALEILWELVRGLNKYVDTQAPWTLAKEGNAARLAAVLRLILECMRKVACCLWPVMPGTAEAMLAQLGLPVAKGSHPEGSLKNEIGRWNVLAEGAKLAPASNLFPRVELPKPETKEAPKTKAPKKRAKAQETPAGIAEFSDFQKLELKIGTVLSCERHPNADKLLKLTVDLGEAEPRQIISGLAAHFTPEELLGKQVCVVANLAPRTIRGLESRGMILTAEDGENLRLIAPAGEVKAGSSIA